MARSLASAQQCAWNGANGTEYWFETWVQAGASAAARTYVGPIWQRRQPNRRGHVFIE
jgi:hypothetical protein